MHRLQKDKKEKERREKEETATFLLSHFPFSALCRTETQSSSCYSCSCCSQHNAAVGLPDSVGRHRLKLFMLKFFSWKKKHNQHHRALRRTDCRDWTSSMIPIRLSQLSPFSLFPTDIHTQCSLLLFANNFIRHNFLGNFSIQQFFLSSDELPLHLSRKSCRPMRRTAAAEKKSFRNKRQNNACRHDDWSAERKRFRKYLGTSNAAAALECEESSNLY